MRSDCFLPSSFHVVPIQIPQTTAHTLCFSFGLLALYPGEQERLYQHIKGVMSSLNGIPVGFWGSQFVKSTNTSIGI